MRVQEVLHLHCTAPLGMLCPPEQSSVYALPLWVVLFMCLPCPSEQSSVYALPLWVVLFMYLPCPSGHPVLCTAPLGSPVCLPCPSGHPGSTLYALSRSHHLHELKKKSME